MSKCIIACRIQSYGPFEQVAYGHLAGLGIRFVEIPVPAPAAVAATRAALDRFGLSASSLHAQADVRRGDFVEHLAAQTPVFEALGTRIVFVSLKAEETPRDVVHERLRRAGDMLARKGLTLAIETHPDLAANADEALATLEAVSHPHIRLNFDTANIYFYNRDVDGIAELRRVAGYVAAVHLKDTDGGYRKWHFPALGRGVVRFPEVFRILDAAGFSGPYTLEIEGFEGEAKTERLVCDRIAESAGYLRGLGRL